MRNPFTDSIVGLLAVLAFSPVARTQNTQPRPGQVEQRAPNVYQQLSRDGKPSGPAPKRDLNGTWAGPTGGAGTVDASPLTSLGQARFQLNKSERQFSLAGTNDPYRTTCDPLGFPRNVLYETRGIAFAQIADRMLELFQYQRVWREIWTDGRALPKNVGAKDGPDPRYYGYSVGHWDGDNTFVVDTVGMDDKTWLDEQGHPHSANLRTEERYTRVDHDSLELAVTMDDAKFYTKPFVAKNHFKWIPQQEFEEQLCVPSEMIEYQRIIGNPAGTGAPGR